MVWLPWRVMFRPVVLLNCADGLAPAFFLERLRSWLLSELDGRPSSRGRHTAYLLYGAPHQWAHYGAFPAGYDDEEVRPLWRNKSAPHGGVLRAFMDWLEGARYRRVRPPWLAKVNASRALVVALSPSREDLRWLIGHADRWNALRHELILALPSLELESLPANFLSVCKGIWTFSDADHRRVAEGVTKGFSWRVPWEAFWLRQPRYDFGLAGDFRDPDVYRKPEAVRRLLAGYGSVAPVLDRGMWEDLAEATACRFFLVPTIREPRMPLDALIAAGRGAIILGPDMAPLRALDAPKLLWPARDCGGGLCHWDSGDLRGWLQNALRDRQAQAQTISLGFSAIAPQKGRKPRFASSALPALPPAA